MAAVIDATVGGVSANSYETTAEAQSYFDTRLPLSGWDNADSQDVLLIMATRVLDALAQPFKTLIPAQGGVPAYYRVRRQWTGAPATSGQRLAWPRTGMYDSNNNALDVGILSISVASPTVVTTSVPHRLISGTSVLVFGSDSTPTIDGTRTVTVTGVSTFTIPVNVTIAGVVGRFAFIPQELKDALAEFAGQLGLGDRTLDNDVIIQGLTSLRAGSVALGFKNNLVPQVIPDAVYALLPQSWLTDELVVQAFPALFEII